MRRSRNTRATGVVVGTASLALLAAGVAANAQASPHPTASTIGKPAATAGLSAVAQKLPKNIRLIQTRTSLLGRHKWYRQVQDGDFVVGGWYGTHWNKYTQTFAVWDGRKKTTKLNATEPKISLSRASTVAAAHAKSSTADITGTGVWVLPRDRHNAASRLVYAITSADGRGARTVYVDAVNGAVLKTRVVALKAHGNQKVSVTGTGRVFDPNPVVKLQDESLRDHSDSATAVPSEGYTQVPLRHLNGSHELSGRYVRIINKSRAHSDTNTYLYNRANDYFEQTSAYYAVDAEQGFLQRLGFTDVNSSRQKVRTDAFAEDNSYYMPGLDKIALGSGGVDDAEDPEVVWHEYGHAIQDDQVIDFGWSSQAAAMGEGFGDYMAVTMSQATTPVGTSVTPTPCVMDWDATSYTSGPMHCLRRTDSNRTYPGGLDPDPHLGGEIWSHALWSMNESMGRDDATKLTIESQFWMYPTVTMPKAAKIMVSTAHQMVRNGLLPVGSVTKARRALLARNLLLK